MSPCNLETENLSLGSGIIRVEAKSGSKAQYLLDGEIMSESNSIIL